MAKQPTLVASLQHGFCGHNDILISRLPHEENAETPWKVLLRLFHEHDACVTVSKDRLVSITPSWYYPGDLRNELKEEADTIGVSISRTTLITFLVLSNARIIYQYADSSGYRAALGSWTGQWYIDMRAGSPAIVSLKPHDSHSAATDVYPPVFPARVDRCVQIMAGVVSNPSSTPPLRIAFPGRLEPGRWTLEFQPRGFALSHGSRHIYNMNGGKVFEIDFLYTRALSNEDDLPDGVMILSLPSLRQDQYASLYVPPREQHILAQALDCLPWTNLSWSLHRGMRDILLAFARSTMITYRPFLAVRLRGVATDFHAQLVAAKWEADFAKNYMGDMAASAVLAERGNSGDAVRIITALAEQLHSGTIEQRDETHFWRQQSFDPYEVTTSIGETVVALTKCVVLEWSVDFDYQMYHQLPLTLQFA
jgi:hypothetical protein